MTLTKEQIEDFRAYLLSLAKSQGGDGTKENAICDLALIGQAVQPRPIEEAPREEPLLLFVCAGEKNKVLTEGSNGQWKEYYISETGDIWNINPPVVSSNIKYGLWKATHFILSSAFPNPTR